ncbi:MAG: energy transducer TonB [Persicimonas sp.]
MVLSVLLHLPLLVSLPNIFHNDEKLEPTGFDSSREFKLTAVEEEPEDEAPDQERDGQFISLEAPEKEERPDEARFLDQFESAADEEMARNEPGNQQAPGRAAPRQDEPSPQQPTDQPPEEPEPPSEAESSSDDAPDSEEEVAEPEEDSEADRGVDDVELAEESPAEEGIIDEGAKSDKKKADGRELFPSMENAAAAFGGGSVDYLRDVEEGDKTLLNRKKSRYWTFMHRLKEQVAEEWSPGEEYRRRDPNGKVYGVKDRFTNLRITLNGDGSLRSLYVAHPSGLDFYDQEAVRAVKEASPFMNPPEGLKDKDGLIHISFGFTLDVRSGSMRDIRIRRP